MMLNDPVSKLIPKMAVPTIVAQLVTVIYSLVDTYFVSSLGTNATAAVGVNLSLEQFINLGATLLAVGTGSYISRLLGAKREEKANEIISTSVFTGVLFSIIIMIVGFSNRTGLVFLLGATEECVEYSVQYATYVLFASPFIIISMILNQTLRSEGSATLSMIGIGFGCILNCFFDPIFIFTLDLGVAGASISTTISQVASCLILLYPYIAKRSMLRISLKHIHYTWKDSIEVISISASSFFRSLLQVCTRTLMNRIAGQYSTSVLAAVSVGNRIMGFPFAIVMGFSQGYQPVVGFNWGAQRFDRVKASFKFSALVASVGSILMAIILIILAGPVVSIFTEADDELLRIGMLYVRFESATLIVHALVAVVNMFYSGIGKPGPALIMSTARQGYCLIPALLILPAIFGEDGITACQAFADVLTLIPGIPLTIKALKLLDSKMAEQKLNPSV